MRNWKGEMIVYAQAVQEFKQTEDQILRVGLPCSCSPPSLDLAIPCACAN